MRDLLDKMNDLSEDNENIEVGDNFDIELNEHFIIETGVVGLTEDGIVLEADEHFIELLGVNNILVESENQEKDNDSGYDEDDPKHPDYAERRAEKAEYERDRQRHGDLDEAEYQGRNVPLGKPMAGDVKKSKVYVRKPNGKVVKVNFGDKKMRIKKSNPNRRKSFRARHRCENPGPRWKARYWSCRAW